jgi:hypothetical protein
VTDACHQSCYAQESGGKQLRHQVLTANAKQGPRIDVSRVIIAMPVNSISLPVVPAEMSRLVQELGQYGTQPR